MFFCEYCKVFKCDLFIEDLIIIPLQSFIWQQIIDILELYFTAVNFTFAK